MREGANRSDRSRRAPLIGSVTPADILLASILVLVLGLWVVTRTTDNREGGRHAHPPGEQGGVIVSLGDDRYHAEALIEAGGMIRLIMLGATTDQLIDVEDQQLVGYVRGIDNEVTRVELRADPQPGDTAGRTSQFVGELPQALRDRALHVTVTSLRIKGERYRVGFAWPDDRDGHDDTHQQLAMPSKVEDDAERQLYLEPAGAYSAADIVANGSLTASQAYSGFQAEHDLDPQAGDRLCPITQTKANATCVWVIAGEQYTFCCPPCIDEFVSLAKRAPDDIQPPEAYVKE